MSANLLLGLVATTVGGIAIAGSLTADHDAGDAPGRRRRITFQVLTYGLVPIVAGLFFFGAWMGERPDPTDDDARVDAAP